MQCQDCDLPAVQAGRCLDCFEEVTETPRWRGESQFRPPKVQSTRSCRACLREIPGARMRFCGQYCYRWLKLHPGQVRPVLACRRCGAELPIGSHKKVWCSAECAHPAAPPRTVKLCADSGCDHKATSRGWCTTHYNRWYYGPDGPGRDKSRNGDPDKRRERNRMQTRRRRARVRDPQADDIYVNVVGERDGWRCGVPGCRRRRIDPSRAYPHPLSPSIDHIEPLSRDGLHTYANVRIAHLKCNVDRRNHFEFEQLAMIG